MKKRRKSAEDRQAENLIAHAMGKKDSARSIIPGIVIDPPSCQDEDDAFWVSPNKKGTSAKINILIADVPFVVPKGSKCDRAASRRGQTYYEDFGMGTEYMFPDILTRHLALGNRKESPRTVRIELQVTCAGDLRLTGISESRLKRKAKLDYCQAEKILSRPRDHLYAPLSYAKIWANILSQSRRQQSGINNLAFLGEEGRLAGGKWSSHRIVAEFMIAANGAIASEMQRREVPMLYRNHHKDSSSAFYSPEPLKHYALGMSAYCHTTSPIRRYADVVNLRIIKKEFGLGCDSYSIEELSQIANSLNTTPEVNCA